MINQIKYIQNLGRYRQFAGTEDTRLGALTLIYSENGKGKTTLCAILRSLTRGDPSPVLERKRLDSDGMARVAIEIGGRVIPFDGSKWTEPGPDIRVFDEHFVDENVYSGLSVEPSHRQGVHALVLGTEGIRYQRRIEDLTAEIASIQALLREQESAIDADIRQGLSVAEFCRLQPIEDIEARIREAEQAVLVLQETEPIRSTGHFQAFSLPHFALEDLEILLSQSLSDLDQEALDAVLSHVSLLARPAERWLSEGERLRSGSSTCPFCGQDVSASHLVTHYRAYFSDAYEQHKERVQAALSNIQRTLGGDALAALDRRIQQARDNARFWATFISVPSIDLDSEAIASCWIRLRDLLASSFEAKLRSPLERLSIPGDAREVAEAYQRHAERVQATSNSLLQTRDAIDAAKEQAGHGSLDTARTNLARLRAIKMRFNPDVDAACSEVEATRVRKADADRRKEEARQALDEQREGIFGTYQTRLNGLLVRLNADFLIEELRPSDRGRTGPPSTTYALRVNNSRVDLSIPSEPVPSFKTALSSGDRNTLALAFFFATLEGQDLTNAIIVIDDPASSLDKGRSLKTVQQIRRIIGSAEQVIVMSHSTELLCRLWEANPDTTATLQIRPLGQHESLIEPWDASAAAETEHDRLFSMVHAYAKTNTGNPQEVAGGLRLFLELFFRTVFPDFFSPGEALGSFIKRCKTQLDQGAAVMARERVIELDELVEYANQFHHRTRGWREALASINETELRGQARDAILLIERLRGSRTA